MSLLSNVVITMIEKELAGHGPEVEAFALQLIGHLASDLIEYIEKKTGLMSLSAQNPVQNA